MWFPSVRAILEVHEEIVRASSGTEPGVLNRSALENAVERARHGPFRSGGALSERAALLGRGIIQDHPFVDGNKRTGIQTMIMFLERNHTPMHASDEELVSLALEVAQAQRRLEGLAGWIRRHRGNP